MSKKKVVAILCGMIITACTGVDGVSAEEIDNSARIAEIEAQIAELQAELRVLKGEAEENEGDVLYEDDLVSIIYDGISGKEEEYKINVIVENYSPDVTLMVQARETSINGFMVDPIFSMEVAPGKKGKGGLKIWSNDAVDNPLSSVESIETKFIIYKDSLMDSYETDFITIK